MQRNWKMAVVSGACVMIGACGNQPNPASAPDCRAAAAKLDGCVKATIDKGVRVLLLTCIPYSKPQRIAGTWAGDFEFHPFFDGQEVSVDRALSNPQPLTILSDDPQQATNSVGIPQTTVKYIEFNGRRPLCDLSPGETVLIVDRIVSERIIGTRPSPWTKGLPPK
jgi:hypothetical protein